MLYKAYLRFLDAQRLIQMLFKHYKRFRLVTIWRMVFIMEFLNYEKKIPASEWFKVILPLLREGYQLKICPEGRSMVPFLIGGRDEAVLSVPSTDYVFKKNDIVLFRFDDGIHVLHRICRINKRGIYTLGDGNTAEEGPIQSEDVLAVADYIIRKGKIIQNNDYPYLLLVSLWRLIRFFRPLVIRVYYTVRRSHSKKEKRDLR